MGYGILQPRMEIDLKSANKTPSPAFLGTGRGGHLPRHRGRLVQDLFGEGIFCGKGILDIEAFYRVMEGKIPENQLLSHDIVEGGYLRCGYLSDVTLLDTVPSTAAAWFDRLHAGSGATGKYSVPFFQSGGRGGTGENPLKRLTRWQLLTIWFEASPRFLAFGALVLVISPCETGGGLVFLFCSIFLAGFEKPLFQGGRYRLKTVSAVTDGIGMQFFIHFLQLLLLPYHSYVALTRASRPVAARFSHGTFGVDDGGPGRGKGKKYPFGLPETDVGGGSGRRLCFFTGRKPGGWGRARDFIYSFGLALPKDQPAGPKETFGAGGEGVFGRLRQKIWNYFETFQTEKDHYLPLDNIQVEPTQRRPTAPPPPISAFVFLCILAACDQKWITPEEMERRLDQVSPPSRAFPNGGAPLNCTTL